MSALAVRLKSLTSAEVRARLGHEHGLLGGVDAVAFGALVLVTGTLLIINAWSVIDTRMAVSAAAREAVRSVVEADPGDLRINPQDPEHSLVGVEAKAIERANEALRGHGKVIDDEHPLTIMFAPFAQGDPFRCAYVSVHVTYKAPMISLPFVGAFLKDMEIAVDHRQRIDPFRSGLAGEVSCG